MPLPAMSATKLRRLALPMLIAAVLAAAAAALVGDAAAQTAPAAPAPTATPTTDYDADDDGLIDVRTLAQLHAIRWDKNGDGDPDAAFTANYLAAYPSRDTSSGGRMGCPSGACSGYELRANLDFDTDGDGDVDSSDAGSYANWDPLPDYASTLKGNGHIISNLTSSGIGRRGLFATTKRGFRAEGIGFLNPSVRGQYVGALAGYIESGGSVVACYVVGGSILGSDPRGSEAEDSDPYVGGLAGVNNGAIHSSYSTASARSENNYAATGGLVGAGSGAIIGSYAAGAVSNTGSPADVGGFIGRYSSQASGLVNNYFDAATSGQTKGVGALSLGAAGAVPSKTTAQLQAPTGYTGIYANWNANLDGVAGNNDDPWHFGGTSDYPTLKYRMHNPGAQLGDYDADDDGLAEIYTLDQLNAVRWDLDGSGAVDAAVSAADRTAFTRQAWVNAPASLGCPDTADEGSDPGPCLGYELATNLDFDTDGSGAVTYADDYPNWTPIGDSATAYSGEFKGNNKIIANLTINSAASRVGLFGHASGTISGVALRGAAVTATAASSSAVGALVGETTGTARSSYATGAVSHTGTGSFNDVGGLVGYNNGGTIAASWSGAHAASSGASSSVGGLAGRTSGAITAAYAMAAATASGRDSEAGGLVGRLDYAGTASASYAMGPSYAAGNGGRAGGLLGVAARRAGGVSSSYWDTGTTDIADDPDAISPEGKTPTGLEPPNSYTGIYADWNVNVDGVAGNDDPWHLGGRYPMLKFGGMSLKAQGSMIAATPVEGVSSADYPIVGRMAKVTGPRAHRAPLPGDPTQVQRWRWQRSADAITWTTVHNPRGSYRYTPVAADVGHYLRACLPIIPSEATEWMSVMCSRPFAKVQAAASP